MNNLKKFLAGMLLALALLPGYGNAVTQNAGYRAKVIRINQSGFYASSVQQIIMLRKLLEPYLPAGVSVEWTTIAGSPNTREAMVTGRIDIGSMSAAAFILGAENGLPLTLLSAAGRTGTVGLFCNTLDIKELRDLTPATRISAANPGTSLGMAFLAACGETLGNLALCRNSIVPIPDAEALLLLRSGKEFQCGIFSFPFSVEAEKSPFLRRAVDLTPIIIQYGLDSYMVANQDFYSNNPLLIEAFRKATQDAVRFMNENPAEASRLLSGLYGIAPESIERELRAVPQAFEVNGYDALAALLHKLDAVSGPPKKFAELPNYSSIPARP
ncbi:MAG: hypothetical protein LBM00_11935 [Deltaproteobacteria bacterium]|jgi:NitT/TauT family transport system substrate-binding protein|nr:hypothetical protein [Deltaproteobacteria bacterium]